MKSKVFSALFTIAIFTVSCSPKVIPLKGSYPAPPFERATDMSFADVWGRLIDVFAQKGLPIKIIDRSSGLIVADQSIISVSSEDKKGKLINPDAFLAVPALYDYGSMKNLNATADTYGEWNVRVKEVAGKTVINVNIVNVKVTSIDRYHNSQQKIINGYKSTGIFENIMFDLVLKTK